MAGQHAFFHRIIDHSQLIITLEEGITPELWQLMIGLPRLELVSSPIPT